MNSLSESKPPLVVEMHTRHIPEIYRRFAELIGDKHWRNRANACKQEIRGNPFLRDYMMKENEIAFQLDGLCELSEKFRFFPMETVNDSSSYPAAAFAAQVLSILDSRTPQEAERFRRRVHGAFRNSDEMRGLRLELSVATHFLRRGRTVSWPETTGSGNFDLLVEDVGINGLEIECKSISSDKGRKVHRREVLDFYSLLKPNLQSTIKGLSQGLSAVLTLPGRLPARHSERQRLAKQLGVAIFNGQSCRLDDGSGIRISPFDIRALSNFPLSTNPREVRSTLDEITETRNQHTMVIGTRAGGALALAVQSEQDDSFLRTIFDTLSDAARRQLSTTRAAMLVAGFDDLEAEQMLSVAQQDRDSNQPPTALTIAVSRFLASNERDHVTGVAFLSAGGLQPTMSGSLDSGGIAYYFPKRESPFWTDSLDGMFTGI